VRPSTTPSPPEPVPPALIVLLAGPSGSGKSSLARRLGLPTVCLDDFYRTAFWRRLVRDLREGRKPPLTLLRRGWTLLRREPAIVARHVALGATPVSVHDAERRLRRLLEDTPHPADVEDAA
jgi:hypothetical protein